MGRDTCLVHIVKADNFKEIDHIHNDPIKENWILGCTQDKILVAIP